MASPYSELLDRSLSDVAGLVRSKQVSPVELVDASLERIAALDGQISAYITVFEHEARQVAKAAELMSPGTAASMASRVCGPVIETEFMPPTRLRST